MERSDSERERREVGGEELGGLQYGDQIESVDIGSRSSQPYTGRSTTPAGSMGFETGQYVGIGKLAKSIGVDARELRSCAQGHGIVADRTKRSCEMFTSDKAQQILQSCGTGSFSSSSSSSFGEDDSLQLG